MTRCCEIVLCGNADEHCKTSLIQGSSHSGQHNEDIASFRGSSTQSQRPERMKTSECSSQLHTQETHYQKNLAHPTLHTLSCYHCGGKHNSTDCHHKSAECHLSHKTGKRAKVCLQKAEQKKQPCRDQESNTNQPTSDDHPLAKHSLYNFYNAGTKPMSVKWSIGQDNTTMIVNTHGSILLAQHKSRGCNYKPHTFTSYFTYNSKWRITEYFKFSSGHNIIKDI